MDSAYKRDLPVTCPLKGRVFLRKKVGKSRRGLGSGQKKRLPLPLCDNLKKATVLLVNIFNLLSLSEYNMAVFKYV